jgi:DNA-binding NtrC family response regulator
MRIGLSLASAGRQLLWRELDQGATTVGSNPECDLCIPDAAVAPVQLLLRREAAALTAVNRNAAGSRIGSEVVCGEQRLADGDELHLGPMVATVRFLEETPALSRVRTRTLPGAESPGSRPWRLTSPLGLPSRLFEVTDAGLTIGSDAGNDVVVGDPYVSAFHARLRLEQGRVIIRDLGSRNGVFVGERKLVEGEVPAGAQLRIGRTAFVLTAPDDEGSLAPAEPHRLLGTSPAMESLREQLSRVAASEAAVLITGETGTGKEVVARLCAAMSPRAARPFIPLNCGALGRTLIESELFGHEKGAFTGAIAKKVGAFEAADGGTLFLDEIGEMPLELQPQLLRVLETGEIRRVGSVETFRADVRLIAATNRRLAAEVGAGSFREDLYHRLHVLVLELPSLRERREDIPLLAQHFLTTLVPAGECVRLSPEAIAKLGAHDWPGNVRELRNVVQRAVLLRRQSVIAAEEITFAASTLGSRVETASATRQRTLQELEREAISAELVRFRGNKTEAAAALGLSRSTIHRKIDEYNIDVKALLAGRERE